MTILLPPRRVAPRMHTYPVATGYPRLRRPRIVETTPRRCLAIEGRSVPGAPEFQAAMGALYSTAYALHFLLRDRGIQTRVLPAEGLWRRRDGREGWSEGAEAFDSTVWTWTLLLPVPLEASEEDVADAISAARRKGASPALDRLFVETVAEGLVVEAMHVGPYATEPETIAAMHRVADAAGLVPAGAHHEIYLGDPRRSAPDRLRTVLRQPVRPAS